ncbi:coenzyme PQQ precursor peptide PqqA [Paraburkholderia sartisoli]|uniref:Coenzyme PQQ synthesis protein A n=1 Tax=Paraburkholderia sartisoli TaxID=83784 RepID=A0A1H4H3S0_9BURK|nr:coenzyme PQQ precursor peptide PqqA [Paraburkholderia sartisoli]
MDIALVAAAAIPVRFIFLTIVFKETVMQWTTPAYTDLRFGFEVTMYIANR